MYVNLTAVGRTNSFHLQVRKILLSCVCLLGLIGPGTGCRSDPVDDFTDAIGITHHRDDDRRDDQDRQYIILFIVANPHGCPGNSCH